MPTLFDNSPLTAAEFLRDYWQKKPLLLRQAFPDFRPDLDPDDIAGLAGDELAEARLVTGRYPGGNWSVRYGPFTAEDFAALPDRAWTLLVQDVEKHYPPLARLLEAFAFLPRWRIDDLMVSVAAPGGSVGPHADQYDVFLLQASGRRRWQLAERFDPELEPDCDLRVLRRFEAEQDWLLEPGDLLYLPPGIAHFGVAEGDVDGALCMTWSIGMRAPSAADLFQGLGEWLAADDREGGRYGDPDLQPAAGAGEIDAAVVTRLGDLARSVLDDAQRWPVFTGHFLSAYRLAHEPAPPPRTLRPGELRRALDSGARLRHNPWTRLLWQRSAEGALLFAAGSAFSCSVETARTICDPTVLAGLDAGALEAAESLVCELVNRGHLFIETV
jgi:50S ribosomal protein L16 3-hydroxylase